MIDKIYVLELYPSSTEGMDDPREGMYNIYTDTNLTSEDLDKIEDRIQKYKSEHEDDWSYADLCVKAEEYLKDNGYTILEFGYNSISID